MKKHLFIAGIERLYSKTTKNIIFLIHSKYPKFVQGTFQGKYLFVSEQPNIRSTFIKVHKKK